MKHKYESPRREKISLSCKTREGFISYVGLELGFEQLEQWVHLLKGGKGSEGIAKKSKVERRGKGKMEIAKARR